MYLAAHELPPLIDEYHALMRHFGQTQARCDALVRAQSAQIAQLQGQVMRLRAAVIVRDTALAWERAQRVESVALCLQRLARERLQWQWRNAREAGRPAAPVGEGEGQKAGFEASDLVICQTGCLSHGDYWRVQDHCRRTGKTCVLVEQPAAARIAGFEALENRVEWIAAPALSTP